MVRAFLGAMQRLDDAARRRFGRPYSAILGAGLVIEIIRRVHEAGAVAVSSSGVIKIALTLLLYCLLLVHQLGELHERTEQRRARLG